MPTTSPSRLAPAWTWRDGKPTPGLEVEIAPDGRIAAVGPAQPGARALPGTLLLPGFVDAHSHAFQRALRGWGERFPAHVETFWTWREAMYSLVDAMTEELVYERSLDAFREMAAAGITTVGEFHYLHHDATGAGFALDRAVLSAARDAPIRLALLESYYARGGFDDEPLKGGQLRFATLDEGEFLRQLDRLAQALDPARATLGLAPHSLRAVPIDVLARLHALGRQRGMVVHLHLEEQPREVERCRAVHGVTPMELVLARLDVDAGTCAVHCTHTMPELLVRYAARGGMVCCCPTTEGNLGDGIPRLSALREAGLLDRLALGTDSNARIDMLEEMRWLEYGQRLAGLERGVLRDSGGRVARVLLDAATRGGATALGVDAGTIEPGRWADFALVDANEPSIAGVPPELLPESLCFGARTSAIANRCVGGAWDRAL